MKRMDVLTVLMLAYGAASLLHFVHNAQFASEYPNFPDSITALQVYGAWLVVAATGVVGYLLMRVGLVRVGLVRVGLTRLGLTRVDSMRVGGIHAGPMTASTPRARWRVLGLIVTAIYAGFGFDGLLHYRLAPMSAHSLAMNATILTEVALAAALLCAVIVQLCAPLGRRLRAGP
jgi:hypothetical protein